MWDKQCKKYPKGTLPILKNGEEYKCQPKCNTYNKIRAYKIVEKNENKESKIYFILERHANLTWCIITDSKYFDGGNKL